MVIAIFQMVNWNQKLKGLLNLFLEYQCPLCQRSTPKDFCPDCQRQLLRCQIPKPEKFWRGELPIFPWGVYGGTLKRALVALKYEDQPQVAQPLGHWLADAWQKSSFASNKKLTIVPIPLHPKKQQERGYNQAELLAESFCQVTGLSLERHGLARVRETEALFSKSAVEREENLAAAFTLGKGFCRGISKTPIMLLDDIYTTGATARSSALVLREHGMRVFGIVAIATPQSSSFSCTP